jgi:uncharacterized membrane protein YjjP (DUF1212 family)
MQTEATTIPERDRVWHLLELSARRMLEFNIRAGPLKRQIQRIGARCGMQVETIVAYRDVTLVGDGQYYHSEAPQLRIDVAVSVEILRTIDAFCDDQIGIEETIRRLETVQQTAPKYNHFLLAIVFGIATAALAWILRADYPAIAVSGVAAALGLIIRQSLGKRHVMIFIPPIVAAFIGGLLCAVVILLGWTVTPGLCLITAALMLIPGAHFIDTLRDLLDNQMLTAISRFGLASGIVLSAAFGVFLAGAFIPGISSMSATPSESIQLTLALDVVLAGLVGWGCAASFNVPLSVLWISILCSMVGHGIRFFCLEAGIGLALSTLLGCFAIGVIAEIAAMRRRLPFSAIAFAAAVPMMPGVFLFGSIAGAIRMAIANNNADPVLTSATLTLIFKATFVIAAMGIGLLVGARVAEGFHRAGREAGVAG